MTQTIVVRHKVGDIKAWLEGHQDRVQLFSPAVTGFRTFQDADDPNSVVLVVDVINLEMLGAIINDPKNLEIKNKHTVIEPITLSMPLSL